VPAAHSGALEKVQAYGDGLDSSKVREGIPQSFTIDASQAGPGPMSCEIKGTAFSASLYSTLLNKYHALNLNKGMN
jgi:hypothetical protein